MRSALVVAVVLLATALASGQRGIAAGRGGFAPHANYGFHVSTGGVNIRTGLPYPGYFGHGYYGGYSPYLYGYVNQPFHGYRPYYPYPYYPYYPNPYYANFYGPYRHYPYNGYGAYYSGYSGGYGYYLGDYSSSYDNSSAYQQQSVQTQQLSNQVNQLTYEVQHLRELQEYAASTPQLAPPPPPPVVPAQPAAATPGSRAKAQPKPVTMTKLIFRDGHTEEVADYAIVGQTLWIFSEQRAMKVPMDKVNVPATQRANEERGLDFLVP